jgi:hypothetical protein
LLAVSRKAMQADVEFLYEPTGKYLPGWFADNVAQAVSRGAGC